MAVEQGYDKVAFVNGQQAADFYDLSKQVKRVTHETKGDDSYDITVETIEDDIVVDEQGVPLARVEALLGKEIAKKVQDGNPKGRLGILTGLDLKVGGAGMRSFYGNADGHDYDSEGNVLLDEKGRPRVAVVPAALRKLMKKTGGEMTTVTLPIEPYKGYVDYEAGVGPFGNPAVMGVRADGARVVLDQNGNIPAKVEKLKADREGSPQPGFTVTPMLRESVDDGMALFSPRRQLEEGHRWLGGLASTSEAGLVQFTD
jgi:hypothetical protein